MSIQLDLDLLHNEEVDMVLRPHPLSFIKHHAFFVYLLILASILRRLHILLVENSSLFSVLNHLLGLYLSQLGMNTIDLIFLVSFWTLLILSGWAGIRLLHTRLSMLYVIIVASSGTSLEIYSLMSRFETPFIQASYIKILILAAASIAAMILIEIHRRRCLYVITNRRVILREGLTFKEEEITYDDIAHLRVEQGILGRIFNFGTINLISAFDLEPCSIQYGEIREEFGDFEDLKNRIFERDLKKVGDKGILRLYGIPNPRRVRIIIGNRQLEAGEP